MRSGFESRGGCGGQFKVKVDRHMICDTGGERIAEYFALLNEGDMMFCDEIVVKDFPCFPVSDRRNFFFPAFVYSHQDKID